ncbi:thioesterase domain-containing protein [Sorangium sp. So ce861]|uniref:thioesterase domain-containing protein n=1 Tax=Sorangium sp. So ce861 TaxID=3133323 RepID=UPI003F5D654B
MSADVLAQNRAAYADLAGLLERAGLAEHALYLNWGYLPVAGEADWAARELPPGEIGGAQARLVLELLGDAEIDGRAVLDVGCGRGGALALLARLCRPRAMIGVDVSPANIDYCRARHPHPRLRFQIADACRLPQPDGSVDVILNLESSGAYRDLPAFFRHARRALKAGGSLLYGDVFDRESVPLVREALCRLGFTLERERSVARQVLAARRAAMPSLLRRLDPALQAAGRDGMSAEMLRYFAAPGSAMFEALESGAADYRLFRFRKPEGAAPAGDVAAELAAALSARGARLDAALGGLERAGRAGRAAGASPRIPLDAPSRAAGASPWFPFEAPSRAAKVNVIALPYAGGGASVYREWRGGWPDGVRFCPVQLPGRETRMDERAITDMAALVAALEPEIARWADRPWALVGCSLGAKIAFEVARRFEARGQGPRLLFLLACPAPHLPVTVEMSHLGEAEFNEEVRRLGGTPAEVLASQELMRVVAPVLRADSKLAEGYAAAPDARVAAPIALVAAEDDPVVPVASAMAWAGHTAGRFAWRLVSGGHFFLRARRDELMRELAAALG